MIRTCSIASSAQSQLSRIILPYSSSLELEGRLPPAKKMDEIAVQDTENSAAIEERRSGLTTTAATNSLNQGWRNSLKDIPHPFGGTQTSG